MMIALRYIGLVIFCLTASSVYAQQEDQAPPVLEEIKAKPDTIFRVMVFDSGPRDSGLESIDLKVDVDHYFISIIPPVTPCSRDTHIVTIVSVRPLMGLHFEMTVTDCAGNKGSTGFIADFHEEIPPVIVIRLNLTDKVRSIDVKDEHAGITDITFPDLDASRFTTSITPPLLRECSPDIHRITVTDEGRPYRGCAKIRIVDCQGNFRLDSICFEPKVGVTASSSDAVHIELIGNPASERTVLRVDVSDAYAASIRVVDLTGREVQVQQAMLLAGRNDHVIGISGLAEGTYYVIADWDGRSYAKKLSVIK